VSYSATRAARVGVIIVQWVGLCLSIYLSYFWQLRFLAGENGAGSVATFKTN
jgi:hypothetical protein